MVSKTPIAEHDILQGLVFPFDKDLDPEAARALLQIRFDRTSLNITNKLLRKNQRGWLSAEERIVLKKYLRIGKFIDVLQAKARKALKKAGHEVVSDRGFQPQGGLKTQNRRPLPP